MSHQRRWIKHGPTASGKIGWELEGSRWVNWGWDDRPPDNRPRVRYHRMETKGGIGYMLMQQRRDMGLDPYTGEEDPIVFKRRQALRRRRLLERFRELHPDATNEEAHAWVNEYLLQYTKIY